jgi:hypothetical protein
MLRTDIARSATCWAFRLACLTLLPVADLAAAEPARSLSGSPQTGCVVAIVGAVREPGVYSFPNESVQTLHLLRTAGGPTATASGSIRVVRQGPQSPQQTAAFLQPQLNLLLKSGYVVAVDHVAQNQSSSVTTTAPTFDPIGRPTYRPFTPPSHPNLKHHQTGPNGQAQSTVRVAVLGVSERPVVLEMASDAASLADVLGKLNQDTRSEANALILGPTPPQQVVPWGDASKTAVVDGSFLLFRGSDIKTSALPEFPEPRQFDGFSGDDSTPKFADSSRSTGPVIHHSPFQKRPRSPVVNADAGAETSLVTSNGNGTPSGVISQTGNDVDLREVRGPRTEQAAPELMPGVTAAETLVAPLRATRPSHVSELEPAPRLDRPQLFEPTDHPVRNAGLPSPAIHESPVEEFPIRVPAKARIIDESQLQRVPAPDDLGRGDLVGETLPPPPAPDVDPLTMGQPVELQGIFVAACVLSGVLIAIWVAARPSQVSMRAPVQVRTPLLNRLELLIENQLMIREEPVAIPGSVQVYGRPAPLADRYLIDTPQEAPAPHFTAPSVRPVAETSLPASGQAQAAVAEPAANAALNSGASKVVRLDASHPGSAQRTAARADQGLLDRVLLNKQGPTS